MVFTKMMVRYVRIVREKTMSFIKYDNNAKKVMNKHLNYLADFYKG